ncbi:MAG: hypothetical protein A2W90_01565 [Bacteroidetes bacterium GWF2_42_66]|nr:MAG: hypothetical protein A2W92_11870 [Bacteroidetes bacterium GWA2_42_15]OFY01058.1 MAG: hypothetical protein A2W89_15050 [Bacteroidetes bacterium GWE2_42_39]OFY41901.1 MAG: hypothetical protein A2W90_01565 [Bacteroidetes bacterium GWF2_42_66]HBL77920.1 hypothetical protein [Prolixibacteraceae bacterium]HCR90143.1 hypothetical protein [Prolixibacteraceae bacterium]
MNNFVNYIIESGISLGLFSLVYFVFLRNETFFRTNRLFLLFAVIFSSVIPLLHLKVLQSGNLILPVGEGSGSSNMLESVTIYSSGLAGSLVDFVTSRQVIVFGYLTVVFVCAALLVFRIVQIVKVIRTSEVVPKTGIKFVYIDEDSSPYSFLSYLFVSRNLESKPGWEKMLAHESEHIRQGHTVDILILELISLFQWFNPFFWMMRRVIKENHEYMADRAVLNKGVPIDLYKQILVSQWVGNQFSIANNFNSSLIKLRLKMMTKIKSSKLAGLRYISGGIMAIALLLVFACENKDTPVGNANPELLYNKGVYIPNADQNYLVIINEEISDRDALNKLDFNNVESISVLKKPVPAYVIKYGEKAQNGVIDITLKSGSTDAKKNNIDEVAVIGYGQDRKVATDPVFNVVEEMPEFPGGENALRIFLAKSVKYPAIAIQNGIQGKVFVTFVVEKDGSVGRVKIARGVDPSLDIEALRVTNSLPKWKPGKQKGEAVAVQYTIPVNFVLQ